MSNKNSYTDLYRNFCLCKVDKMGSVQGKKLGIVNQNIIHMYNITKK